MNTLIKINHKTKTVGIIGANHKFDAKQQQALNWLYNNGYKFVNIFINSATKSKLEV